MNSETTGGSVEPPDRNLARRFVIVQFVILIPLVLISSEMGPQIPPFPIVGLICIGLGLAGYLFAAGNLGRTLTAMPIPKADGKLCTSGLYRFVRHPIYSFILIFCLGLSLQAGSLFKYVLTFLLAIVFYYKSKFEERYLLQKYPDYEAYSHLVPRFIPFTK